MNDSAKIALITGAAKRLGQAIALEMALAGWDIAIHCGKSIQEAELTAQQIRALGRRVTVIQADLADQEDLERVLPQCIAQLGIPSCLINNASIFSFDDPQTVLAKDIQAHMVVNLTAPLILSKSYYEAWKTQLTKSSAVGVTIHVLDQKLDNMNPDFFSYTLSKAALESAMHMQAMSFAPFLRVVGIAPGITLVSGDQTAEGFQKAHQQTPLGRSSLPSDIAQGVCYLATANAVTGTTLYVDGGQHLQAINRDIMFLTDLPTKEI